MIKSKGGINPHSYCQFAAFLVAMLAVILNYAGTAHAAANDPTPARIAAAMQDLHRYTTSHSIADLRAAVSSMGGTADSATLTPANFISHRRDIVAAWAQILKAIEDSYDPTLDVNAHFSCPAPPMDSDGTRHVPCSNPAVIKDATARAKYIAELDAFNTHVQRLNRYQEIRNIDAWAMTSLSMSLDIFRKVAPDGTTADFAALDQILRRAGISDARRSTIDGMFYARPGI